MTWARPTRGNPHKDSVWYVRRRKALAVIARGGGYAKIAEVWGVSRTYAYVAIRDKFPELQDEIHARRHSHSLKPEEIVHRLRLIASGMSYAAVARQLGLTPAAITRFLQRHAPDGVEDALETYEDDENDRPEHVCEREGRSHSEQNNRRGPEDKSEGPEAESLSRSIQHRSSLRA